MNKKHTLLVGLLLANLAITYGQALSEIDLKHLNEIAISIDVDASYENGYWKPVRKYIKNKRIVLLGEFNHGSREVFVSRNDLIKYLHENLGFNVVLFETGIGELGTVDLQESNLSPQEMTYGFFNGWRTREFEDLMQYIKEKNIAVGGFDVQRTGNSFKQLLEAEAKKINLDSIHYHNLEERFTAVKNELNNRKAVFDAVENPTLGLINDYKNLETFLKGDQNADKALLLTKKTISNRIAYLSYFLEFVKDKDWNKRWEARDFAMASNVEWLINTFYKNEKIIVVAHNFHIAKFNEKEEVMGEFLKKKYGAEMYSLGVFAGKGSYLGNSGNEETLSPPDSEKLDIKSVIEKLDGPLNFVNIPEKPKKGYHWLFDKVTINDTFIDLSNTNEMVLSKHFDGILLLDKVSVPQK